MWQYNYLCHWGIKGMKWGVRRYQNPDGTLTAEGKIRYSETSNKKQIMNKDGSTTFPKGFVFNRVGQSQLDVNASGALYVSIGVKDTSRYIKSLGPTLIGDLFKTSAHNVQHIKVVNDIRMPSKDETVSISVNLLKSNPKLFKEFKDSIYSMVATDDPFEDIADKNLNLSYSELKGKKGYKIAYALSSMLGDPNYYEESKQVYAFFRSKGYDAIPDLHDLLSGTSETAMIIINPNKVVVSSSTYISKDVKREAIKYVKSLDKLRVDELIS